MKENLFHSILAIILINFALYSLKKNINVQEGLQV
jgi:hypothetical protein